MSAGTLSLTNNSFAVAGNGTSFTTELSAGDFVVVTVGGVPYTLPVNSVNSDTSLTLVSNYTGPTQSGAAWSAVPRVALNMVTAALVAQSAEALRGLNYDKQNWQQVYSSAGNISVKLSDGSSFNGPSWKYLADNMATKVSGAVPVNQGGTGATTAANARTNLGLGSAATMNVQSSTSDITANRLLYNGSWGLGAGGISTLSWDEIAILGKCSFISSQVNAPIENVTYFGLSISHQSSNSYAFQIAGRNGDVSVRTRDSGAFQQWMALYHSGNTTVDSNGFIKKASPIVKIFSDGQYELNEESKGVIVIKKDTGVYLISGVLGLNADGIWWIELPKDINGNALIWADYEVLPDGNITLYTYHREHPTAPTFARNVISSVSDGEPIDIPQGRFVSLRVNMPDIS